MPAVDFEGRILLESPGHIAMSPDGHGGSLRALERSGALDLMAREGIDTLSYFQVDNPLVRCIDPTFIGWHLLRGSEMSSKMVPKAYAGEKVGHFCQQRGRLVVVEYSDLPKAMQEETDAAGGLRYLAGSIIASPDGTVWTASPGVPGHIQRFDPETGTHEVYKPPAPISGPRPCASW